VQFRRKSRAEVSINMAPLIDVIFLLVIFFAVSTTFLESSGLKLELPTSASSASREVEDLTVVLSSDGRLYFDDEEIDREDLEARLKQALAGAERKVVVLRADTHTQHGEVVALMDLIRQAGATSLTVATRHSAEK
jgi:biopolymer transport protein ExbD